MVVDRVESRIHSLCLWPYIGLRVRPAPSGLREILLVLREIQFYRHIFLCWGFGVTWYKKKTVSRSWQQIPWYCHTVAECRKRWHALRDKFRRQLKQEESGEVKVVEWELMNPLRFVQPFMKRWDSMLNVMRGKRPSGKNGELPKRFIYVRDESSQQNEFQLYYLLVILKIVPAIGASA